MPPFQSNSTGANSTVDFAVYLDGIRVSEQLDWSAGLRAVREGTNSTFSDKTVQNFIWLGLHEPDAQLMNKVAEVFQLHELLVEDAVHAHQRPKFERYDNAVCLVIRTVNYVEHTSWTHAKEIVETGEILIILGADFVITVRHGDHHQLSGVRHSLEQRPDLLRHGPAIVMHSVADYLVDSYLAVADLVENDIDNAEETIFTPANKVPVEATYLLKREVVEFKRAVSPLTTPLQQVASDANSAISADVRKYFRDVLDHQIQVSERVATFDDVLTALISAGLAKVSIQQNIDMRKISSWVAIASVPTMIAGIYGMNFDNMPELHWKYGYFIVLLVLASVSFFLFRLFRKNDWL